MTMLVPLGALALGAVFSGMIWYNVFFGYEDKMRAWFGMEAAAHHEAAEGDHAATDAAAPAETATATDTHGAAEATEAAAPEAAAPHGVVPTGGIYLAADNTMIHQAHDVPKWVKVSPFVAMILGLGLAWLFYIRRPDLPGKLAAQQRPLYLFLLNKWYFDEIYAFLIVGPVQWLGRLFWKRGDGDVIDGTINGVALGIIPFFTRLAGRAQSGYLFHYAFAMVLGIAALITMMTLFGGAQ